MLKFIKLFCTRNKFFILFSLQFNHFTVLVQWNDNETCFRNHAIAPVNQLLCTLRYYDTGSTLLAAGDFSGLSKTTAHRIVHRVSAAIASLRPTHIKFPNTADEIKATQLGFYNIARFPLVVGAMDCTHVKIASPGGPQAELYRCRKGYFSLNCQAICNSNLEFTDIVARWAGSSHDLTIFNASYRRAVFEHGRYGNSVLLVDGGYNNRPYLMAPLLDPRYPEEHLFNESQIRTRNVVERLFGVWKRRFPVLVLGIRMKLDKAIAIVVATAVLHNILRRAGEQVPPDDPDLQLPASWDELIQHGQMEDEEGELGHQRVIVPAKLEFINYFRTL